MLEKEIRPLIIRIECIKQLVWESMSWIAFAVFKYSTLCFLLFVLEIV